jgi:glucosamine kinase
MVTMRNYLAIDAGGTSTRAVFLPASGKCLGYGVSGGGNPVSRGFDGAIEALLRASSRALGGTPQPISSITIGMAGASLELATQPFRERFTGLGLSGNILIESDLLATFYSGTCQDNGYALIAGTGAVAARISDSTLAAVADGTGWLLGDSGAGFWLGREVVRAVAAALDGRGKPTALVEPVLAELGISSGTQARTNGRVRAQQQLIAKIYALAPIELSRFAPMVFDAGDDAVARDITDRAAAALAGTLTAVVDGTVAGPLVFGGSVLTKGGTIAGAVVSRLAGATWQGAGWQEGAQNPVVPILVADGMAGAAVLALKRAGEKVDEAVFERISASLAELRA